jgi:hypothetical protein
MSSANAPSEDVKDMLEDSGSGLGLVFGTDLFIASMPDQPNNAVCLYDAGGAEQGQFAYEQPNIQVIVRNINYQTGYSLCRDIKYYLHQERNNETWNGTRYISISCRSDILTLGQDKKNRYEWSINFRIERSGT